MRKFPLTFVSEWFHFLKLSREVPTPYYADTSDEKTCEIEKIMYRAANRICSYSYLFLACRLVSNMYISYPEIDNANFKNAIWTFKQQLALTKKAFQ